MKINVKEVTISQNSIVIEEERIGLFGTKTKMVPIDIKSIGAIERLIKNEELIGIVIWDKKYKDVLHAIGIKNYEKNLEELYEKIINSNQNDSFEIKETDLS